MQQQRIGLVILSYPAIYDWSESDLWPYQVTAAQLAVAIDTRRQQLLLLRSSQQVAVLQERQRLARELHDSVTQLIFSITLIAQSIAPAWSRDRAEGENRVNRLLELSQSALAEMRALLFELRSPEDSVAAVPETRLPEIAYLRQEGLVTALRRHVETLQQDGLTIAVDVAGYRPHPPEVEVALFRITQEALHNVVKHARATQVAIHLSETTEAICLEIADDGVGFRTDTNNGRFLGGLGMHTMGERAEALGGYLKIRSAPGEGTAVIVRLPQKEEQTP
ncbi:MAG: sensor histidine kinase [Chloroflexi bacterium]|nr:sensor histidine kinase [Chloroflexota bacterium]